MASTRHFGYNWFIIPLLVFIAIRTAAIWSLYHFTGGIEFTMDQWVFELGLHPLSLITFSGDASISHFSQPPLFPFALAPFAITTSLFMNSFLASRVSFTLFELIGFLVVARFLFRSKRFEDRAKRTILLILAISPIGFMAGSVMSTEEAIVMIFTAALLWAMEGNRLDAASLIIFLGIFTGKILFGIMFFPLLLVSKNPGRTILRNILPTVIILALYCLAGYLIRGVVPFIGFHPESTTFCLSIFSLAQNYIDMSGGFMVSVSLALMLVSYAIIWLYRSKMNLNDTPGILLLSFIILFLFFYHITPEYLIFALPLLAVFPAEFGNTKSKWLFDSSHAVLALASSGFGIMYGLRIYSQGFGYRSSSKDTALRIYREIFGNLRPEYLEQILLAISIISLIILGISTIRRLRGSPQIPR